MFIKKSKKKEIRKRKGRQFKVLLLPFSADEKSQKRDEPRDQRHGDPDNGHSVVT